ncbi:MAG TPA: hypothetical protein VGH10_00300 [Actinomycetota bacterium]|jgi:sulfite exporter TauE/SafE
MLGSITPLGERGRGSTWAVTAAFYIAGSAIAGAAVGAGLGGLGRAIAGMGSAGSAAPAQTTAWILAAVTSFAVAVDLRAGGLRLPSVERQVNEEWLYRYRGWVYGLGFGLQLGTGVVTIVTTAAVYLTWLAALLTASPLAGGAIGLAFGLGRAAPMLSVAGVRDQSRLLALDASLRRLEPLSRRMTISAEAALGGSLLAILARGTLR